MHPCRWRVRGGSRTATKRYDHAKSILVAVVYQRGRVSVRRQRRFAGAYQVAGFTQPGEQVRVITDAFSVPWFVLDLLLRVARDHASPVGERSIERGKCEGCGCAVFDFQVSVIGARQRGAWVMLVRFQLLDDIAGNDPGSE